MTSSLIKIKAKELGFDLCGIARSRRLTEREDHLRQWISQGCTGTLEYMSRNLDKRLDPALLVDSARSVIVCGTYYRRDRSVGSEVSSHIASYALTTDYHITMREKLNSLLQFIKAECGAGGRVFVDTAPILEKSWAAEAGLGWIGRNSLLINPEMGSFLILGLVVIDKALDYDEPYAGNGCKGCRACIEACPVNAILPDRSIDASRCISALTIEGSEIDYPGDSIFGCDICQNVCPFNIRTEVRSNEIFAILPDFLSLSLKDWLDMDESEFRERFGRTPLARVPLDILKKRLLK